MGTNDYVRKEDIGVATFKGEDEWDFAILLGVEREQSEPHRAEAKSMSKEEAHRRKRDDEGNPLRDNAGK
jgi:hypothetical protein